MNDDVLEKLKILCDKLNKYQFGGSYDNFLAYCECEKQINDIIWKYGGIGKFTSDLLQHKNENNGTIINE